MQDLRKMDDFEVIEHIKKRRLYMMELTMEQYMNLPGINITELEEQQDGTYRLHEALISKAGLTRIGVRFNNETFLERAQIVDKNDIGEPSALH